MVGTLAALHMRAHAHALAAMLSGVGPNEISQSSLQVIIHGSSVPTRSLSRAMLCSSADCLQPSPGPATWRRNLCQSVDSLAHARRDSSLLPVTSYAVSVEPRTSQTLRLLLEAVNLHHFSGGDRRFSVLFRRIHRLLLGMILPNLYMALPSWFLIACCGSDTSLY